MEIVTTMEERNGHIIKPHCYLVLGSLPTVSCFHDLSAFSFFFSNCSLAGDSDALKSANGIIDAVIANLQKDGALVEACDSEVGNACSINQAAFKGITVYFMYVHS